MNSAMRPTKKCKCSNNVDALLNKRTLISTIGYWFYKFQYYYYLVYYLQIPFQTMDICVYIYIYIFSNLHNWDSNHVRWGLISILVGFCSLDSDSYPKEFIINIMLFGRWDLSVPDLILAVIIAIIILLYSSLKVEGSYIFCLLLLRSLEYKMNSWILNLDQFSSKLVEEWCLLARQAHSLGPRNDE